MPRAEATFAAWAVRARRRAPAEFDDYLRQFEAFFDDYAGRDEAVRDTGYRQAIGSLARYYVPPGARVLEIGCGAGDLLSSLRPSHGVGIDLSKTAVDAATQRHPGLVFHHMAAERLELPGEQFDYVILSDVIGYLYDIRQVLERIRGVCHPRTRIVIHWYSRVWQPAIALTERAGWRSPLPYINWTDVEDVRNLLGLAGFETVRVRGHIALPLAWGRVSRWINRVLPYLPVARLFVWTNWMVARPVGAVRARPSVTVVCPCRNERGNIEEVVRRLPALGRHTQLIFVEGHSTDGTLEECRRVAAAYPDRDIKVLAQRGRGKGDAVRLGFAHASGELLIILDADLSVAPEDLPQFYDAVTSNVAEFVMGSRLVYSMDEDAMRVANRIGNRFFSRLLGVLVGQPIKDTLCGTKALWKADYERLAAARAEFGGDDPFGDFDLILGAARLNLRIVEVPVRYRSRTYGSTNISRFADGWLLLRMSVRAAARLFFIA